jgi:hypothetical protein
VLASFLHALPYVLGGAFCLLMLYGFWQGLSLRPHRHRAHSTALEYWWSSGDR